MSSYRLDGDENREVKRKKFKNKNKIDPRLLGEGREAFGNSVKTVPNDSFIQCEGSFLLPEK